MELPEIRPEERTPLVESLLGIIHQLLDQVQRQEQTIQELRDEIAHLKGQKPRPQIQPSRLESKSTTGEAPQAEGKRPGSAKRPKTAELTIHRHERLCWNGPPPGPISRFEPYVVQDLRIEAVNTRYERARYEL